MRGFMVAVLVVSSLLAIPAVHARARWTPPLIDCGIAGPLRPGDYSCRSVYDGLYQVRDCFAKDVVRRPDLGCRVQVLFSIAPNGTAEASLVLPAAPCSASAGSEPARSLPVVTPAESAVLGDETIESCIAQVTAGWRLPPDDVIVSYLFIIRAGNGGELVPPFEIAPLSEGTDGMGSPKHVRLASSDGRLHHVKANHAAAQRRATPADAPMADIPNLVILRAMNGVQPEVHGCYDRFKVPGIAMVRLTVDGAGKVPSAVVTGNFAGTPTGACVEHAVKHATFPPSAGGTIDYLFPLR